MWAPRRVLQQIRPLQVMRLAQAAQQIHPVRAAQQIRRRQILRRILYRVEVIAKRATHPAKAIVTNTTMLRIKPNTGLSACKAVAPSGAYAPIIVSAGCPSHRSRWCCHLRHRRRCRNSPHVPRRRLPCRRTTRRPRNHGNGGRHGLYFARTGQNFRRLVSDARSRCEKYRSASRARVEDLVNRCASGNLARR